MASVSALLKRRKTVTGSIAKLVTRLESLEARADQSTTYDKNLNTQFKKHHYEVIDLIDEIDDDALTREQAILDEHDDLMAGDHSWIASPPPTPLNGKQCRVAFLVYASQSSR